MIARSSFFSKKLGQVADPEHLLFYALILNADDEGRGEGDPYSIKLFCGNRAWTEAKVERMMTSLAEGKLIAWYECECGQFYAVIDFGKYQGGSWMGVHKKDSTLPDPAQSHCTQCSGTLRLVAGDTRYVANSTSTSTKGSKDSYREDFEEWYIIYPRKKGKAKASEYYATHRAAGISRDDLLLTCHKLIDEIQREGTEMKFVPYASTFLGPSGKFMDYLDGTKSPTCSTCNSWTDGYCGLREEATDEDATCGKWTADIREGE